MFIMKNKFVILPIIVFFNFLALNSQQIPKQEETLKHMLLANNYFMSNIRILVNLHLYIPYGQAIYGRGLYILKV